MWKNHNFWAQPQFLFARNSPDLSPQFAESNPARKRAAGSQNAVHELHSDSGEDRVNFSIYCLPTRIAARAVIFVLRSNTDQTSST
jgi:hypothetical protein